MKRSEKEDAILISKSYKRKELNEIYEKVTRKSGRSFKNKEELSFALVKSILHKKDDRGIFESDEEKEKELCNQLGLFFSDIVKNLKSLDSPIYQKEMKEEFQNLLNNYLVLAGSYKIKGKGLPNILDCYTKYHSIPDLKSILPKLSDCISQIFPNPQS